MSNESLRKYGLGSNGRQIAITTGPKKVSKMPRSIDEVTDSTPRRFLRVLRRREDKLSIRLEVGSLPSLILEMLYEAEKMTMRQMQAWARKNVRMVIHRLAKRDLVRLNDDKTFSLTPLGRWHAIAAILEISFIELCLLAKTCMIHWRHSNPKGKDRDRHGLGRFRFWFYTRHDFNHLFGDLYTKEYMQVVFSTLKRKGFAIKFHKSAIQIWELTWRSLRSRYEKDFEDLENWLDELEERNVASKYAYHEALFGRSGITITPDPEDYHILQRISLKNRDAGQTTRVGW